MSLCVLDEIAMLMKTSIQLLVLVAFLFVECSDVYPSETINPVIGDAALIASGSLKPFLTEQERIRTHLLYAEKLLRASSNAPLSARSRRNELLDHLHDYAVAGVFPSNRDHVGRKPCFIDDGGNICAVGYLVEKTAGREAAESINEQHQYDELLDMHDAALNAWAASTGFSLEELAMIQPTYNWRYREERIQQPRLVQQPLITFAIQAGAQENAGDKLNVYYPMLGVGFRYATTKSFFLGLEANYHRISDNVMQSSSVLDFPLLIRSVDPYFSLEPVFERRSSPVYFEAGPVGSFMLEPFRDMRSFALGALGGIGLQWDLTDPTYEQPSRVTQMSLSTRYYHRFTALLPRDDIWRRSSVQILLGISR
jgi:hypothetical protein